MARKSIYTFSSYLYHKIFGQIAPKATFSILLALLEIFTALLQALLCAAKSTIIDHQVINLFLCGENSAIAAVLFAVLFFASAIITARAAAVVVAVILFASSFA